MGVKMRGGEGVSKDNSWSTSYSGRKTIHNCKGNLDNVVVIDVDSDGLDSVVIIDVPESLQTKLKGYGVVREKNRFPLHGIISIDDDDEDDEDEDDDDGGDHVDDQEGNIPCEREMNNIGDSSKSSPASDSMEKSVDAAVDDDDDDCRVVQEQRPVFNLSRCSKSHAEEASSRNRYGLNSELESDSESDSSDCEILLGYSGKLREQWEKASLKKKYSQSQSGLKDQTSPCSSCSHSDSDFGAEDRRKRFDEGPEIECSIFGNAHCEEFNLPAFIHMRDGCEGGSPPHLNMKNPFAEPDGNADQGSSPWWSKSRTREKTDLCNNNDRFSMEHGMEDHTFCSEKCPYVANVSTRFVNKKKDAQGPSKSSNHVGNDKDQDQVKTYAQEDEDQNMSEAFLFPDDKPMPDLYTDCGKNSVWKEKPNLSSDHCPGEIHNFNSETSRDKFDCQDMEERSNGIQNHRILHKQGTVSLQHGEEFLTDTVSDIQHCRKRDPLCGPQCVISAKSSDIINKREKLKETDEYKQAVEQEWAARQHQLQLQAEEAQRLRKRRKAESLRILDMEKRQKQRLEEVRETQKKDEENLYMKERLRADVRKELHILEMTCFDMASLLRQLGIPVEGGVQPLSHEVHAAYKRALLKFHPDRVSRSDIRQQVEAEEKFKLICRMKEKFLSS